MRKLIALLLSIGLLVGCTKNSDDGAQGVPTDVSSEEARQEQIIESEASPDCTTSNVPCMPLEWQSKKFSEYQLYFRNYWKENFWDYCPPTQDACTYDGTSFLMFGVGNDRPDGINHILLDKFLGRMEMPVVEKSLLENTTSIMGLQSAEWEVKGGYGTITAQWTYHPDPGLVFSAEISSPWLNVTDFDPNNEQQMELLIDTVSKAN